jgi:hypothetical protein
MADTVYAEIKSVRFLFWPVTPTTRKPTPAEARAEGIMFVAGELPWADRREGPTEWEAVTAFLREHDDELIDRYCRRFLRAALRRIGAKKFVPHRPPSWAYVAGAVELCFYHNKEIHTTMFESDPMYVMQPTGDLQWRLEQLYAMHGTYDTDPRMWTDAAGDEGTDADEDK